MSINRRAWLSMGAIAIALAAAACGKVEESGDTPAKEDERGIEQGGRCESFGIKYGPNALPPAVRGVPYEVKLADHADEQWRGASYRAGYLPPGLELVGTESRDTLVLRGVVDGVGEVEISVDAAQEPSGGCAMQPDMHRFRFVATE